ncbi:hypothetical protein ACQQ2Q_14780 [Agrobacterium sp. ES01]|uniref:hypothetical protein n=1 Tax=Agrobacterium sp. ES01 TaxID=3420714 RepID=UPI003D0CDDA9
MGEVAPSVSKKLRKLLPLLSSNHAGEVFATAQALQRTLKSAGLSLHDLADLIDKKPQERIVEKIVYRDVVKVEERIVYRDAEPVENGPSPQSLPVDDVLMLTTLLLEIEALSKRERDFISNMRECASVGGQLFNMTEKQTAWLWRLAARHLAIKYPAGEQR